LFSLLYAAVSQLLPESTTSPKDPADDKECPSKAGHPMHRGQADSDRSMQRSVFESNSCAGNSQLQKSWSSVPRWTASRRTDAPAKYTLPLSTPPSCTIQPGFQIISATADKGAVICTSGEFRDKHAGRGPSSKGISAKSYERNTVAHSQFLTGTTCHTVAPRHQWRGQRRTAQS
jgi:hypothetical protein